MKVKTSELSDVALCYVVCMIEMPHLLWGKTIGIHHASPQIVVPELPEPKCYSPYMSWETCGPIIEREKIDTAYAPDNDGEDWYANMYWRGADCVPGYPASETFRCGGDGPTPLIAAMRCYVASKLGDEVEIPEELCVNT